MATTRSIRELLINKSRQFIYTSALPDHLCSAAIAALPIAKNGKLQKRLQSNTAYFSSVMKELGFELANTASQIIPIIIGQERAAMEFSKELLKEGVFAQAIRYPTVRKGHARIRISVTAMHRRKQLEDAASAFEKAARRTGILH